MHGQERWLSFHGRPAGIIPARGLLKAEPGSTGSRPYKDKGRKGQAMANDSMDRRTFLKLSGLVAAAGAAMPASQLLVTSTMASTGATSNKSLQFAMTVNLNNCDGCKECEKACRKENNVPDLQATYGED